MASMQKVENNYSKVHAGTSAVPFSSSPSPSSSSSSSSSFYVSSPVASGSKAIDIKLASSARRRLLFLVNPASGSGHAVRLFKRKVLPMLVAAADRVEYQVLVTTARYSAFNYLQKLDVDELLRWSGVVIVSGDGLLFEVFNALLSRPDWQTAIQVPIGIIPAGSGNGLAYSISYANGEVKEDQVIAATQNVLSGRSIPMDIVKVTNSISTYYSFLSIGWGLIADIDIESERLRILGGGRFTVWALVRTMSLRRYAGRLHFLPVPGYDCNHLRKGNTKNKSLLKKSIGSKSTKEHFSKKSRTNGSGVSSSESSVELQFSNNSGDDVSPKNTKGRLDRLRSFSLGFRNRRQSQRSRSPVDDCEEALEHCDNIGQQLPSDYLDVQLTGYRQLDENRPSSPPTTNNLSKNRLNNRLSRKTESDDESIYYKTPAQVTGTSQQRLTPKTDLRESMPGNWQSVEEEFVLVYATYQTHISQDCILAPSAKLDDNVIWLLYLTGEITRKQVMQFLLKLDSGTHVDLPFVNLVPVRAFRLEPLSPKSRVTVDGELIETETLQAQIMPCVSRMLCK